MVNIIVKDADKLLTVHTTEISNLFLGAFAPKTEVVGIRRIDALQDHHGLPVCT